MGKKFSTNHIVAIALYLMEKYSVGNPVLGLGKADKVHMKSEIGPTFCYDVCNVHISEICGLTGRKYCGKGVEMFFERTSWRRTSYRIHSNADYTAGQAHRPIAGGDAPAAVPKNRRN